MTHTIRFASILLATAALVTAAATLIAQQNTGAPVVSEVPAAPPPKLPEITSQDLLNGFKNPARWLTYSGDYTGQRHSPLKQITPENVGRLAAQWTFQTERHADRPRLRGDAAGDRRRRCTSPAPTTSRGRSTRAPAGSSGAIAASCRPASPTAARTPVEPRLRRARRPAVHGHARRAPARARSRHRQAVVWDADARRLQDRLRRDAGAAGRQGQGDRRHLRRRLPDARIHRRLRREDRQARLALLHHSGDGRAGQRDVAGRPRCCRAAAAPRGSPAATIRS